MNEQQVKVHEKKHFTLGSKVCQRILTFKLQIKGSLQT